MIILLGGGTKKGQQADIERAKMMWAEYKVAEERRKAATIEVNDMVLTRSFKHTIVERIKRDPAFAKRCSSTASPIPPVSSCATL